MLKNITFSADSELIARARERAQAQNATLNDEFRRWLVQFTQLETEPQHFRALMATLSNVEPGKKWSREEANSC